jgi:cytochrome c553
MRTHWRLASAIQTELVRGNLDVVRTMARRLASLPPDGVPESLRGPMEQLRSAAVRLENADDLEQATVAVAELGAVCADCHRRTGGGPPDVLRSLPPEEALERRMVRHQLAADWMWLGLIGDSQAAWDRGARDLTLVLPDTDLDSSTADTPLEDELREVATRAVGQSDPAARAASTAELLAVCVNCHRVVADAAPGAH